MMRTIEQTNHLASNILMIEHELCPYLGYSPEQSSKDFVTSFSEDALREICPSVLNLPAALIIKETEDTCLVSIHLSSNLYSDLDRSPLNKDTLKTDHDVGNLLILIEEISHFHYFARHAESRTPLTKLEMEIQAELEKVIVASLIFNNLFGFSHVKSLTQKIFNESEFTGTLTDYRLASKTVELFWKKHLQSLGEDLVFNDQFRRLVRDISHTTGPQKMRLLSDHDQFIAA